MEEISFAFTVAGLLITIVFGVWGGKTIINRHKQKQKVSGQSVGIMAGRDVKVGESQERDDKR